ncbi:hypothetical protein F4860DRAFT_479924 [Xylaria cubensis]|nr:hypothetical protein F4860DRAFT_479924 [Xylaria cubensis]
MLLGVWGVGIFFCFFIFLLLLLSCLSLALSLSPLFLFLPFWSKVAHFDELRRGLYAAAHCRKGAGSSQSG